MRPPGVPGSPLRGGHGDDLNTAQALGYLFDAVRLINRLMEEPSTHPGYLSILHDVYQGLLHHGRVLNLSGRPQEMVKTLRQKAADLKIAPAEIERLISERIQARKKQRLGPGRRHPPRTARLGYPAGRYPARDGVASERINNFFPNPFL